MTTYMLIGAAVLLLLTVCWGTPPTPTARGALTGYKMPDGYQSYVTFASNPTITLWEKAVKPPGIDGGEPIDTTTMHNIKWRTFSPRSLLKLDPITFTCAYDPDAVWNSTTGVVHLCDLKNDTITVLYPEGSTVCFYGFLQKFEPAELKEGEFPEATATIMPTNWDNAGQSEQGPVFSPSGT